MRNLLILILSLACGPALADPVTAWTRLADKAAFGAANWRTLVIMHQAMHDAWNAADPHYARWFPPAAGEPPTAGAKPEAAMAAAARRVLLSLNGDVAPEIEAEYAHTPQDPAGRALGDAIGAAAVARRNGDGYERRHPFADGNGTGRWKPAPSEFSTSNTTETRPFLFAAVADNPAIPPPPLDSQLFRDSMAETLRLGGGDSGERTGLQTDAAFFWAYQSSQRGFVILAAALLEAHPRQGGLAEHAAIMAKVTAAMADSAILIWFEKERFNFIRPIWAIQQMVPGEADWQPLIATPPHPEYPSGHASDCYTGAYTLQAAMPDLREPITYVVQLGEPPSDNVGMGQHAQARAQANAARRTFATLLDAAEECANSRIWAGAHFRPANEESRRVARMIAARAAAALP